VLVVAVAAFAAPLRATVHRPAAAGRVTTLWQSPTGAVALPPVPASTPSFVGLLPASPPPSAGPTAGPIAAVEVSALAADGIPQTALLAYTEAAARADASYPSCALPWPLLAAIGRVESDHGRAGGAVLYSDGTSSRKIIGIRLDGTRAALIRDTDHGRLDGDTVYDHAVGPMQFIPSTWARYAADGNGDGVRDPFNVFDAAAAAADYLCLAGGDLNTAKGQARAVLAYNHSSAYLAEVLGLERVYAAGVGLVVPVGPHPPKPPRTTPPLPPVNPGPPAPDSNSPGAGGASTSPAHTKSATPRSGSASATARTPTASSSASSTAPSCASSGASSSSAPDTGSPSDSSPPGATDSDTSIPSLPPLPGTSTDSPSPTDTATPSC
jgi:hypothetical protein